MTPEETKALAEALAEALTPTFDGLREALTPKPVEVPAEDEEVTVDRAEIVEAAVEAGLSKAQRTRVLAAVTAGETLEEAIKAEQALRQEILAEQHKEETPGTFKGDLSTDAFAVRGW